MRSCFLLIIVCPLFAGCFTISTLNKAKFDRKPETADSILTSYREPAGNIIIIYTKPSSRHIYKVSQPVDSIIMAYRNAKQIDLVNPDAGSPFKGVFFTESINGEKGYQRILLFEEESALMDTTGLAQAISYNENIAKPVHGKFYIPVSPVDSSNEVQRIRGRSVSFVLNTGVHDSSAARKETYVIAMQPRRRKYTRYLLLPLTVAADAITLPFQAVGLGTLCLVGKRVPR